jgi:hypothetical protein
MHNRRLIEMHHDPTYCGHCGVRRTQASISRTYWWPGLAKDVRVYVQECPLCQINKSSIVAPAGLLQPMPIPEGNGNPLALILLYNYHAQLLAMMPLWWFVIAKLVQFIPTTTTVKACRVARLFIDHFVKHHGLPASIVSNRDSKLLPYFGKLSASYGGYNSGYLRLFILPQIGRLKEQPCARGISQTLCRCKAG